MPRTPRTAKHPTCGKHRRYHLTCGQYDALVANAVGLCGLCGHPPRCDHPLNIDHDHAVGWSAVRGLICCACNTRLGYIEKGRRKMDPSSRAYLASPWYADAGISSFSCPADCPYGHHRRPRPHRAAGD